MSGISFGIDFGTTNSACTGILNKRRAIHFEDQFESPFPSIVLIDKVTGEVYRGRDAWSKRIELSESCEVFTSIKSILGESKQWNIAGKIWSPEMIAAEIFLGMKELVNAKSGDFHLKDAVVSVPVGFPPNKRKALRNAAKLAGVNIKSFVSESTAAVLKSFEETRVFRKIAVFDWGGGTLDISIVENRDGMIREVAVGNLYVGGDDVDEKLANWVHNNLVRAKGINLAFDEMPAKWRDMLLFKCEQAKRALADEDSVTIRMNKYGDFGMFHLSLDIDQFSELIEPIVLQAFECMDRTMKQANLDFHDLGCVLMVGGSTNLRPFLDRVEEWECHKIYPENSEWSVSEGAAWLNVEGGEYRMAEDVGVVISNGEFYPIVREGESMQGQPISASFALVEEAESANLIFSNNSGEILGYTSIPAFGFFKEQIDITVHIDDDLVLQFSSKSRNRSEKYKKVWSYTMPKMYYRLPRIERKKGK